MRQKWVHFMIEVDLLFIPNDVTNCIYEKTDKKMNIESLNPINQIGLNLNQASNADKELMLQKL